MNVFYHFSAYFTNVYTVKNYLMLASFPCFHGSGPLQKIKPPLNKYYNLGKIILLILYNKYICLI